MSDKHQNIQFSRGVKKKPTDSRLRAYRADLARSRCAFEERRRADVLERERRRAEALALVETRLRPWDDIPLGGK